MKLEQSALTFSDYELPVIYKIVKMGIRTKCAFGTEFDQVVHTVVKFMNPFGLPRRANEVSWVGKTQFVGQLAGPGGEGVGGVTGVGLSKVFTFRVFVISPPLQ